MVEYDKRNELQDARKNPGLLEMFAAVVFTVSTYIFLTLVIGNYLVFAASPSIQQIGSYLLTPIYYLSVVILRLYPFDEGLWAFSAFFVLLLSIAALRMRQNGWRRAVLDSLTIIGPAILVSFGVGVYFLIPSYFYSQVTNFVGRAGLGNVITNWSVLAVSTAVLLGRFLFQEFGNHHRG